MTGNKAETWGKNWNIVSTIKLWNMNSILFCFCIISQSTRPDWPWGPPSLLYNGYRVFSWGKAAGAWHWPPTPPSAKYKERVQLYLYSSSGPSWAVIGWPLPLPLLFHNEMYKPNLKYWCFPKCYIQTSLQKYTDCCRGGRIRVAECYLIELRVYYTYWCIRMLYLHCYAHSFQKILKVIDKDSVRLKWLCCHYLWISQAIRFLKFVLGGKIGDLVHDVP